MSGVPKRSHEEASHSTPGKRPLDDSSLYSSPSGKLVQPGGSDFHGSFEHDGRFPKVPRIESRDDKRPSLAHRMPIGSSNFVDHSSSSDGRLESKQNKDPRDTKVDVREAKADTRDVYSDSRVEFPGNKVETDVKTDNRTDENEIRADRRTHGDYKGDAKLDKDGHPTAISNIAWKDNKEHRGKRNIDPSDNSEWRFPRPSLQGTDESAKVPAHADERSKDAHESTGENKTEPRTEDKFRDKDRKKKDEKHREFGTRDNDRNDRRIGIQLGGNSVERKENQREDRDAEKWDRERKDSQKDKEGNDREKDPAKESSVATEKDNAILEKTASDGAVKSAEHENKTIEQKTLKDDTWKSHDRDPKDKKREKDMDAGERHDQRSKYNDKESDDTFTEGDIEKDKEALGSVQRRRMVRPRGGSQASQRDHRFRSRVRDGEGSQDKSEVSAIVYKAGECMQELLKSWKEFEATPEAKNAESVQNGPTLEIRIPAEFVTSTNRQVKGAQLWGTDVYTNDSDLVAVLMHTGYCSPTSSPPPSAIQELRATVRVLPPQDSYTSTLRNNVRSRAWGAGIGCSFRIERCCIVKKGGGTIDLEPRLSHTSAVEPTLAPVAVERTMTTRAAASNALRQQRFVREVTIQYNLCNEPWLKYSISIVADKGLKKSLYTSARLKKGEVIYLETHYNSFHRYELCFSGEKTRSIGSSSNASDAEPEKHQNSGHHHHHSQNGERASMEHELRDLFRWSRCKKAMPETAMRSTGIPLPPDQLEVLQDNLEWEDVQWSQTGVWVAGKEYPLARVHFLSAN
ncbi:eukaryotic translation initiation factor 3 subunit A isoform X1 [Oryza brachyantha]|uniref:eukaryotic translation initiation factor 3 subunit A isoform X1 n=1 Tax=Oryza brachyantha TaxID=4533 RepID=UPI0003EA9D3F|nr:eukaryotic translation initiation factor 3 subunit A isoform X1 [Oryza brachyantha]